MVDAFDVLTLLASLFVTLLLLSDVRDELLRACRPALLRALENAGVLTRDEYARRAGGGGGTQQQQQQQLHAGKQELLRGASAAGAFARSVVAEQAAGAQGAWAAPARPPSRSNSNSSHHHQQQQHPSLSIVTPSNAGAAAAASVTSASPVTASSSSYSTPLSPVAVALQQGAAGGSGGSTATVGVTSPASVTSSSSSSSASSRGAGAGAGAGNNPNAALAATSARQSESVASPATQAAANAAAGHLPAPLPADQGQLRAQDLHADMQASAAAEAAAGARPQRSVNSRSHKQQASELGPDGVVSPGMTVSVEALTPSAADAAAAMAAASAGAPSISVLVPQSPLPEIMVSARGSSGGSGGASTSAAAAAAEQLDLSLLHQRRTQQAQMDGGSSGGLQPEVSVSDRGSRRDKGQSSQNAYGYWLAQQHHQQQQASPQPSSASSLGAGGVPLIAGHPLTSLSLSLSSDAGLPVEEYFTSSGEKIAWRRAGIWDSDFIYSLSLGQEFMKYGNWGRPHIRKVRFMLAPVSSSSTAPPLSEHPRLLLDWGSDNLCLEEVTGVVKGKGAGVFAKRYAKDASVPDNCCFTIVTPRRTLDLQVLSTRTQRMQQKRDLLVFGLGEITGTRTLANGEPAAGGANGHATGGGADAPPIAFRKIAEACLMVANAQSNAHKQQANQGGSTAAVAAAAGMAPFVHGGVLGNGVMAAGMSNQLQQTAAATPAAAALTSQSYNAGALSALHHQQREYSVSTQLPLYTGNGGSGYSVPGTPASVSHSLLGPPAGGHGLRSHYSVSPSPPFNLHQQHQHQQQQQHSHSSQQQQSHHMLRGAASSPAVTTATTASATPMTTSATLLRAAAGGTPSYSGTATPKTSVATAAAAAAAAQQAALQQQIHLHQLQLQQLQQRQLLAAQQQQQAQQAAALSSSQQPQPRVSALEYGGLPPPSFPPATPAALTVGAGGGVSGSGLDAHNNAQFDEHISFRAVSAAAPAAGLSGWLRDLTHEGVESNPGPVCCQHDGCRCTNSKSSLRKGQGLQAAAAANVPNCECGHPIFVHEDPPAASGAAAAAALPVDTRALFTILEELPHRIEAAVLVAMRSRTHTVSVQGWSGHPTLYLSVCSYSDLETQLCRLWGTAGAPSSAAASSSAPPPLVPSSFTLYYVPPGYAANAPFSHWFHARLKVTNEAELQSYLFSFPPHARHTLLLWQPSAAADPAVLCSAAAAAAAPAKVSPTKDQAPVMSALLSSPSAGSDAGSTATPRSRSSADSRDSSVQADFANGVRMRDGAQCIVCNDPTMFSVELEAAHVVPLKGARSDQWQAAGLSSPNDTRNGLVLCVTCHFFFDKGLWCIDPIDRCTMLVTDALAARRAEWSTRHGQVVRHVTPFHPDWPTQQTLQVQFNFMHSHTAERHAEQAKKKFECPYCGKRYASDTSKFLTEHVRKHADANEPIGKWTIFHTPAKKK